MRQHSQQQLHINLQQVIEAMDAGDPNVVPIYLTPSGETVQSVTGCTRTVLNPVYLEPLHIIQPVPEIPHQYTMVHEIVQQQEQQQQLVQQQHPPEFFVVATPDGGCERVIVEDTYPVEITCHQQAAPEEMPPVAATETTFMTAATASNQVTVINGIASHG